MKKEYPNYKIPGSLPQVEAKLNAHNKKILFDFLTFCSTTAGERKVSDIKRLMLQIYDIIEKDFDTFTKEDIVGFLAVLNKSDRLEWTKNGIKTSLKRFVKWHYKNLEMTEIIKLKDATNHNKINKSKLLEPEELEAMIRQASSLRDKAIIMVLYESAARPEELRNLLWNKIKFGDDVTEVNLISKKTGQARTTYVQEATVHLKRWKQEFCFPNVKGTDFVFPAPRDRQKPISDVHIWYLIKKIAKDSGIQKTIYPYIFRHSRLTELLNKQVPEQDIKKFAGHTPDSRMMRVYNHMSTEAVKNILLEKVYHIEEISEEQQNKYDKVISEMQKQINKLTEQEELRKEERDDFMEMMNDKVFVGALKEINRIKKENPELLIRLVEYFNQPEQKSKMIEYEKNREHKILTKKYILEQKYNKVNN